MVEKTVVIEFGSSYVRAGLSGDYYPRYSSSSQLRRCDTAQGEYVLYNTILKALWEIFLEKLHVRPKECRVLIIEKILEVRSIRDIVLTILLRELQVGVCDIFAEVIYYSCNCCTYYCRFEVSVYNQIYSSLL